jgi:uncharacterized protein (DUF4415 family)
MSRASKATKADWAEARRTALENLREITDEEDAEITAAALSDPDAQPADELIRKRGRPFAETTKEKVSLRLDPDVLAHFRATGPGWQTRLNDALRKAAGLRKAG